MMELNKQHLFTIDSDNWTEIFIIRVIEDIVTIAKHDEEMVFGDLEDAIEAIGLIHKALKEIRNGN